MEATDKLTQEVLLTVAEMGAAAALRTAGVSTGEICKSEGERRFGRWFIDQVKAGNLRPVRCGHGSNGKRWFSVEAILALKASQQLRASVQLATIHN